VPFNRYKTVAVGVFGPSEVTDDPRSDPAQLNVIRDTFISLLDMELLFSKISAYSKYSNASLFIFIRDNGVKASRGLLACDDFGYDGLNLINETKGTIKLSVRFYDAHLRQYVAQIDVEGNSSLAYSGFASKAEDAALGNAIDGIINFIKLNFNGVNR
jgi:hypothetical protein